MVDREIRYAEQVTNELGLAIAAAIPRFPKGGVSARSPEQVAHLVESFRTLRMHVRHACEPPITVAISSPSPSDGKLFVAANLAMSFADAGFQTVLVDGDTRRGMVNEVFGLEMGSGLNGPLVWPGGLLSNHPRDDARSVEPRTMRRAVTSQPGASHVGDASSARRRAEGAVRRRDLRYAPTGGRRGRVRHSDGAEQPSRRPPHRENRAANGSGQAPACGSPAN